MVRLNPLSGARELGTLAVLVGLVIWLFRSESPQRGKGVGDNVEENVFCFSCFGSESPQRGKGVGDDISEPRGFARWQSV